MPTSEIWRSEFDFVILYKNKVYKEKTSSKPCRRPSRVDTHEFWFSLDGRSYEQELHVHTCTLLRSCLVVPTAHKEPTYTLCSLPVRQATPTVPWTRRPISAVGIGGATQYRRQLPDEQNMFNRQIPLTCSAHKTDY